MPFRGMDYARKTCYDAFTCVLSEGRAAMPEPLGLYVHIPFCARKCAYCDFPSWAGREGDIPRYAQALQAEIRARGAALGKPYADTVFFGGGTPSLLPPEAFFSIAQTLREAFAIAPDAEFTVECNPGTLTPAFADALSRAKVNRLSMGMQASQERLLRLLGRIHTLDDVRRSAALAHKAGIDNLNLDLMLGLPGQTLSDMCDTLREALALHPAHVSCYALIVEEGTPLKSRIDQGALALPDEDTERAMYDLCRDTLQKHGFRQYEISNFALPGRACRHNENCWKRLPYLGFGCAAHGLYKDKRRENPPALTDYLNGKPPRETLITPDEAMFESLMLGLRLTRGISESDFLRMHGRALWNVYGAQLSPALRDGRLAREDGFVRLTTRGMDVMNSVLLLAM